MKIYNAIKKLANKKVIQVAYLNKGQIRRFRKHLIVDDEIAK